MPRKTLLLLLSVMVWADSLLSQPAKTPLFEQSGRALSTGTARFQFLSPTLVRMEQSPRGTFTDAPSTVVQNRAGEPVTVKAGEESGWLVATAGGLTVRYRMNTGAFSKENLRVLWTDGAGKHSWAPGDSDRANLGGISYSLDGARKGKLPVVPPGILSRSGYFLLDDSRTPVWDSSAAWIVPRPDTLGQDWYFFTEGTGYRHLLKEYAALCGSIPMVPRYTLGAWVTDLNYEYVPGTPIVDDYHYTDENIKEMIGRFRREQIPLDVLVLDFAWHKYGWDGGYDWSPIFPDPGRFLAWAHEQGLRVTLNDHPGYDSERVLSDQDSHAPEIKKRLNMRVPPPPKFTLDLTRDWRFRVDPRDEGMRERWYAPDYSDSSWETLRAGDVWEEQGHPGYDGVAWYRKRVTIPHTPGVDSLFLVFGGVDDEYDLFIDGKKIAHYGSRDHSVFGSVTATEISGVAPPGGETLIALRVTDWGGGGGLSKRPDMIADRVPQGGTHFNLADKRQAEAFMDVLHNPLIDQGVDFWWIDGGSGAAAMPGLNPQLWTNRVFYDMTQEHTGKRTFIFSRYGGWGDHRYPGTFTGDTYSQWDVLSYEVPFTARGGNVLMPYVTHDIGGFISDTEAFDLYARWLQFGAFSPILRLHCSLENPRRGNLRLPWVYGRQGTDLARSLFQLRYRLIPYIYTYCRIAHDEALPLVRPLYLEYPALDEAYAHPDEYFFGREIIVAPIVDSTGERDVYLPPGDWVDFNTGRPSPGGRVIHVKHPLETMPLFVRAGSVIPLQPDMPFTGARPLDTLIVEFFPARSGEFRLYEDDGLSLDYRSGKFAWTPITCSQAGGFLTAAIGPTKGEYAGQVAKRAYELRIHRGSRPASITVNGRKLAPARWDWSGSSALLTVHLDSQAIRSKIEVAVR